MESQIHYHVKITSYFLFNLIDSVFEIHEIILYKIDEARTEVRLGNIRLRNKTLYVELIFANTFDHATGIKKLLSSTV